MIDRDYGCIHMSNQYTTKYRVKDPNTSHRTYITCRKLNETPFPFPWAQGIVVVLMIFTVTVPFVFTTFIDNTIVAALASAVAVQTYIMMNEVANDIEDPFHYDPNQLPLPQMQYRLNERLLAVSKTERPLAFTDVGAIDGPSNIPQLPPVRATFHSAVHFYFLCFKCCWQVSLWGSRGARAT